MSPLSGQDLLVPRLNQCRLENRCTAWWITEFAVAGANSLIGGLYAGVRQELRGGSFSDGFARGSLGGFLSYAGKRIITGRFPGAGLFGRQVGAVGHSMIRNAAESRGLLSRVALPLPVLPARLQLGDWGRDAPVRFDAISLSYFLYGMAEDRLRLDLVRSFSWGSAVFVADEHLFGVNGGRSTAVAAQGSVFFYGPVLSSHSGGVTGAHERVHVVQMDMGVIGWGDAVDDWIEHRLPFVAGASRLFAFNAFGVSAGALEALLLSDLDHAHLPWEVEAIALEGNRR